jgi:hypothetical protein
MLHLGEGCTVYGCAYIFHLKVSQQLTSSPKGNVSSVEAADIIPACYVSFIVVMSNTRLLNCMHTTEKHIYFSLYCCKRNCCK